MIPYPSAHLRRKTIVRHFIGGAILGGLLGWSISGLVAFPFMLFGSTRDLFHPALEIAVCILVPACAIGMGYRLAKGEYREQLESSRLHSHFCKRCGYDLRGITDAEIVCPECGTGIPDQQRKHIKRLQANSAE
jgi:hypothetical protein